MTEKEIKQLAKEIDEKFSELLTNDDKDIEKNAVLAAMIHEYREKHGEKSWEECLMLSQLSAEQALKGALIAMIEHMFSEELGEEKSNVDQD